MRDGQQRLLEDRAAVITGAAGGLGREIARIFGEHGARVIALDNDADRGRALVDELASQGARQPSFVEVDVSSSEEVARAFDQVAQLTGSINVLVNCAGVREISPTLELPLSVWENVIGINLSGTFYCCQIAAKRLMSNGGSIINLSSVAGLIAIKNRPAYTASKHGIVGLTKCLAKDFGGLRIRVNAICPGLIKTPLTESYFLDQSFLEAIPVVVPLGTAGRAIHVAQAALFLASDMSDYVTGVALPVDGGWLAEKGFELTVGDSSYSQAVLPDRGA